MPLSDIARGLFVGTLGSAMQETALRLARLLEMPKDIPMLAPMILRELHYRLLSSEYGPAIAQIAIAGSNTHRIGQIIRRMKSSFAAPIRVEELAAMGYESTSQFSAEYARMFGAPPMRMLPGCGKRADRRYYQPCTFVRTRTRFLSAVMYNVLPSSPNPRFAVATPVANVPRCLPCGE